jgi:hypothetical protein
MNRDKNIRFNKKNSSIEAISKKTEDGFTYSLVSLPGGNSMLSVVDSRTTGTNIPIALISNLPEFHAEEEVEEVVEKAVRLYKNYNIMSVASSLGEFESYFNIAA